MLLFSSEQGDSDTFTPLACSGGTSSAFPHRCQLSNAVGLCWHPWGKSCSPSRVGQGTGRGEGPLGLSVMGQWDEVALHKSLLSSTAPVWFYPAAEVEGCRWHRGVNFKLVESDGISSDGPHPNLHIDHWEAGGAELLSSYRTQTKTSSDCLCPCLGFNKWYKKRPVHVFREVSRCSLVSTPSCQA